MKTRWQRHCELRAFDNWCLQHPRKANLFSILAGLVIFAAAQLLEHLHAEILLGVVLLGACLFFLLAGVAGEIE